MFSHLRRAWGRARWKMVAIIFLTGCSTLLTAYLATVALNVLVRRESANIVEKQIRILVQVSSSVAPAILEQADVCALQAAPSRNLTALLAYTAEAFPQAQVSLLEEDSRGVRTLLGQHEKADLPAWLPPGGFAGLVVDRGNLEIRDVLTRQKGACRVAVDLRLPLGAELAKQLSSAAGVEVTNVSPSRFPARARGKNAIGTVEGEFIPGSPRLAGVVLTARNWETGATEDWMAYRVAAGYERAFEDLSHIGRREASWVWLIGGLLLAVVLTNALGAWVCIRFGRGVAIGIDDLSMAAHHVAAGNFSWRTLVRTNDQVGELVGDFNEMAAALERLHKQEIIKLQWESELDVARRVQEYLYPRIVPELRRATVSGKTSAAHAIGGDLYDFFDLGPERVGLLCADVSGKGVPAALMMANLQAIARAQPLSPPAHFVETLNQQLCGRFGDNRYATLFWADYNTDTADLMYVNAGHPAPILLRSSGEVKRLDSGGFPIGMYKSAKYTANRVSLRPGDRLLTFTDGLTDAQNPAEEEFGEERLMEYCQKIPPGMDAAGITSMLMQAVAVWSLGAEQFDDTTLVVMNVAP